MVRRYPGSVKAFSRLARRFLIWVILGVATARQPIVDRASHSIFGLLNSGK
jgi:hypothetical protein